MDNTDLEVLPRSRTEAIASGAPRYFTGKPCKYGHTTWRHVGGTCSACQKAWGWLRKSDPVRLERDRAYGRERMRRLRSDPATYEIIKARNSESQKRNKKRVREYQDEYRAQRLHEMAGRPRPECCEVCGSSDKICFDHCHKSGEFRGWICDACNTALGRVADNPEVLRRLAEYLERHNSVATDQPIGLLLANY